MSGGQKHVLRQKKKNVAVSACLIYVLCFSWQELAEQDDLSPYWAYYLNVVMLYGLHSHLAEITSQCHPGHNAFWVQLHLTLTCVFPSVSRCRLHFNVRCKWGNNVIVVFSVNWAAPMWPLLAIALWQQRKKKSKHTTVNVDTPLDSFNVWLLYK